MRATAVWENGAAFGPEIDLGRSDMRHCCFSGSIEAVWSVTFLKSMYINVIEVNSPDVSLILHKEYSTP